MREFTLYPSHLILSQLFKGVDLDGVNLIIGLRNKDINNTSIVVNTDNGLATVRWGIGINTLSIFIGDAVYNIKADDVCALIDAWLASLKN